MYITKYLYQKVLLKNLGFISYEPAMNVMKALINEKKSFLMKQMNNEPPDQILVCEHQPVYTVGLRTENYKNDDMINNLKKLNAEFHFTNRGGLITFHGPGQLVFYPVINLKHYNSSVRCYIHNLEEVIIKTCCEFGIESYRTSDIGIWIGNNKIAAVGVHCRQYITSHGLALNCNTDLSWFDHIVPCGLVGKHVTSITQEINKNVEINDVLPILIRNFENVFNCKIEVTE